MVRADVVAAKLAELTARVAGVRKHTPATAMALRSDQDALDLASFNLMLCVQAAVDIASHLVADEGWRPALTLADAFDRLHENAVSYASVDIASVFAAASPGVSDLDVFAAELATWVQARTAGSLGFARRRRSNQWSQSRNENGASVA